MMRVGRLELHSDKAFGKILEHHHICEALIDLFERSSIIPILSFETCAGILVQWRCLLLLGRRAGRAGSVHRRLSRYQDVVTTFYFWKADAIHVPSESDTICLCLEGPWETTRKSLLVSQTRKLLLSSSNSPNSLKASNPILASCSYFALIFISINDGSTARYYIRRYEHHSRTPWETGHSTPANDFLYKHITKCTYTRSLKRARRKWRSQRW